MLDETALQILDDKHGFIFDFLEASCSVCSLYILVWPTCLSCGTSSWRRITVSESQLVG